MPKMTVMVLPTGVTTAAVYADGTVVGAIEQVTAPGPYEGFDGQTHVGTRWLPVGIASDLSPGPTSKSEGALLLLALNGYDHARAAEGLGLHKPPTEESYDPKRRRSAS